MVCMPKQIRKVTANVDCEGELFLIEVGSSTYVDIILLLPEKKGKKYTWFL